MANGIKIVGKIDLEEYMKGRKMPVRESGIFKLMQIKCSFYNGEPVLFDFGEPLDEKNSVGGYFSLLLGKNGTCKSSLLREIIEFFIDARGRSKRKKKNHVVISYVKYNISGLIYEISYSKNKYLFFKDEQSIDREEMEFPLVIASTMGMFDKFPINSQSSSKNGRYDQKFYHYVGPKANSNLFTSKANVLLQQFSALPSIKRRKQLEMLGVILDFIGYEQRITFKFNPRDSIRNNSIEWSKTLSQEDLAFYERIYNEDIKTIDINLKQLTLQEAHDLPLKSLFVLRQKGYISSVKCYFYKNKDEEVASDYLSSGEFNLLCIVMSVVLAADSQHLLLLLDEPEISQHPNWQLDLIPNLEKALVDFGCHFLIATHCHFLVSNLPMGRSNVICISRDNEDKICLESLPSDTYGWSSDEVLLKAFGVPTDRNRYLAQMVSDFLKGIANRTIEQKELDSELSFFRETTIHLSSVDPMKKILDTIIQRFDS